MTTEGRPRQLVRLRARPDTLYVSQGRIAFATDLDGCVSDGPEHGLFVHETRLLSRYRYLINGEPFAPVALSNVDQHTWLGYYIALPPGGDENKRDQGSGQVQQASQQTLELRVSRYVGGGLHEDLDFTNFAQWPTRFTFEIDIGADFADQIETKGGRKQNGKIRSDWSTESVRATLTFHYHATHEYANQSERGVAHLHRGLIVEILKPGSSPRYRNGRIAFDVVLPQHEQWHCCVNFVPVIESDEVRPAYGCRSFHAIHTDLDRNRQSFLDAATQFRTPDSTNLAPAVSSALQQSVRDLAALRLNDLDENEDAWTMAAGLPMYIALFGRDTLTAAWQAAFASTAMLRGTLPVIAKCQGESVNDWRDEQPGRMIHEAHTGPLAVLNYNPRLRYYGSITTSAFYPVALSELWHWTGDKDLIRPLIEPALRALKWLEDHADLDGDGFYEYLTRSEQGVKNQAWKDSGDAMVYEDGSQVEPPIATCEEQGFAYAAKLHLSEVLWWLGEKDLAQRLYREAREFKQRFNDAFWMEDEGFYAMGLDSQKRQIRSIGSNPGHCVATAIADDEHAQRTADRLFEDDLFSGWGIRTLSSKHPAYNPYSYHRGTIWPVEQGTFALGFFRYGLHERAQQISRALFEAAALFDFHRLPECFTGHPRDDDHPFPAIYPQANAPQAWSASAVFCLVQSMLGLYPYAPLNMLLVDPHLPEWLPQITVENLRVGRAVTTIRFFRKRNGASSYEVLDKQGALHVLRQPSPWSLTASVWERTADLVSSLAPGR
jgi:glycogen debranching enzyme